MTKLVKIVSLVYSEVNICLMIHRRTYYTTNGTASNMRPGNLRAKNKFPMQKRTSFFANNPGSISSYKEKMRNICPIDFLSLNAVYFNQEI